MSHERKEQRPAGGPGGPGAGFGRGPMAQMGMPVQKARDFKGTLKRLLGYLKPRKIRLLTVFVMAILSTVFSIVSPKILGKATTTLFEGIMMKYHHLPGARVDFDTISQILLLLIGLYLFSAFFSYLQQYIMAGVAQKTVYDIRNDVNDKLARLPLKFFDSRTHGEILSRVTNDVDNISSTLQQSLTQLITSIVTIAGILIMMLTISPLMTLIAVVTLPLSFIVTAMIARRSQKYFAAQQKELGNLSGHVEETVDWKTRGRFSCLH